MTQTLNRDVVATVHEWCMEQRGMVDYCGAVQFDGTANLVVFTKTSILHAAIDHAADVVRDTAAVYGFTGCVLVWNTPPAGLVVVPDWLTLVYNRKGEKRRLLNRVMATA